MTVFWLHGEDFIFSSSIHHVQQRIPQMKMLKVHIPFTFKLEECSTDTHTGNRRSIRSSNPWQIKSYHSSSFCRYYVHHIQSSSIQITRTLGCLNKRITFIFMASMVMHRFGVAAWQFTIRSLPVQRKFFIVSFLPWSTKFSSLASSHLYDIAPWQCVSQGECNLRR